MNEWSREILNVGVVLERLTAYLESRGYPRECLVPEWQIRGMRGGMRVDLAVIVNTVPVALFEIKIASSHRALDFAATQLRRYSSLLRMPTRLFVVFPKADELGLEFYELSEGDERCGGCVADEGGCRRLAEIPIYKQLVIGLQQRVAIATRERLEERVDELKPLSRMISLLLFMIFLTDFVFSKMQLNTSSTCVLIAAALVGLAPYYDIIKWKDIGLIRKGKG